MRGAFRIASREQHFSDPWVGSWPLNRAGLHLARMLGSSIASNLRVAWARRRWPTSNGERAELLAAREMLERDGIVVLEDFIERTAFERVRAELHARFAQVDALFPQGPCEGIGYGPRRSFDGGFDRCDGSTQNRFLFIDDARLPASASFARDERLQSLIGATVGLRPGLGRFVAYRNRLGDDEQNHDVQMDLHRDTFHPAFKLWYFVDDVRPEDGPFEYVVGSHRLDVARLGWEHRHALEASRPGSPDTGGSFRIDERELVSLGLPMPRSYPVAANTLILANVLGFHRRGRGIAGGSRMSIHGRLRTQPFDPRPRQ